MMEDEHANDVAVTVDKASNDEPNTKPDVELMGRLQLIAEQPLEQRAAALEQLYHELKPLVD